MYHLLEVVQRDPRGWGAGERERRARERERERQREGDRRPDSRSGLHPQHKQRVELGGVIKVGR